MARRILCLFLLATVVLSSLFARAVPEDDPFVLLRDRLDAAEGEVSPRRSVPLSELDRSVIEYGEELPPPEYYSFILEEPGRVSVQTTSSTGAVVSLIERGRGVIASDGRLGERDGRVDIVLDAGEYRVETQTVRDGEEARIEVHRFQELNSQPDTELLMTLQSGEVYRRSLRDLEQRSFWIVVDTDEHLDFEAMGRSLTDVVIWRDGVFAIEAQPGVNEHSPEIGRRVGWVGYHRRVEPGNYLVTFYGGPPRVWENEGPADAFYIRRNAAGLEAFVDQQFEITPFGRDFYRVPGETTFFQLENPDMTPATIGLVRSLDDRGSPRFLGSGALESDAVSSRVSFGVGTANDDRYMVIHGSPGDTVRVRSIPVRRSYRFPPAPSGSSYLISTLSSLDAEAVMDATPLLSVWNNRTREYEVVDAFTLTVTPTEPLFREINLFEDQSVFVEFDRRGNWGIVSEEDGDAEAAYALIPVRDVTDTPRPQYREGPDAIFDLEAGLYELRITPRRPGIHRFVVYYRGDAADLQSESQAERLLQNSGQVPRRDTSFITSRVSIGGSDSLLLTSNNRGPVRTSVFVEALPLILERSVPLTLDPGDTIALSLNTTFTGGLVYDAEGIEIEIDGERAESGYLLQRGRHTLTARNTGDTARSVMLHLQRQQALPPFQAPEIPPLEELYPTLVAGEAVFVDIEREQTLRYILDVNRPGLYELQTTGRLNTGVRVRTAVDAQGEAVVSNGPGRNALLQDYFRAGRYLVEVSTVGQSAGRMGLTMRNLERVDGGIVRPGPVYRSEIPANHGLMQEIHIPTAGAYRLDRYSLHGASSYRFEDMDGWPADPDRLVPGIYRHIVQPRDVWSRHLLQVVAVDPPRSGDGGFDLIPPGVLERMWRETPDRAPQQFSLAIPAPLRLRLELPQQMEWSIWDASDGEVAHGTGTVPDLDLSTGTYRLLVRSIEENDNFFYRVEVNTAMLAPGISQTRTRMPSTLDVSVPEDGIYELWSLGRRDIRARLTDDRRELAFADDRSADWNVMVSRFLEAGTYRLELFDSFPGRSEAVSVHLFRRSEIFVEEQAGDIDTRFTIGPDVVVVPFRTGASERMYSFSIDRREVSLSLYRGTTLLADTRDGLDIALEPDTRYTVRMVSDAPDPIGVGFRLTGSDVERIEWMGERALPARQRPLRVENRPGVAVSFVGEGRAAPGLEIPLRPVDGVSLANTEGALWLLPGSEGRTPSVEPMRLEPGGETVVYLTDQAFGVALAPSADTVNVLRVESVGGFVGLSTTPDGGIQRNWSEASIRTGTSTMLLANRTDTRTWVWDAEPVLPSFGVDTREHEAPYGGRRVFLHRDVLDTTIVEDRWQGSFRVPPRSALILDPGVADGVELLLEPGLMAGADNAHGALWTVVATVRKPSFRRELENGRLFLANPGDTPLIARVIAAPAPPDAVLAADRSFSRILGRPVDLNVRIPELPSGATLRVYAPGAEAVYLLSDEGSRINASQPGGNHEYWTLPGRSGSLAVSTDAEPLAVWAEEPGIEIPLWLIPDASAHSQNLTVGLQTVEPSPQQWRFELDEPSLISISSFSSGAMGLYRDGERVDFSIGERRNIVRFAQAGEYRLFTRSLAGEDQDYPLEFSILDPVSITESEPPPRVLLDSGQRSAFSFEVERDAPVGLGLGGSHEDVAVALLDEDGNEIASGRLLYRELPHGRYFLIVENRGTAGSFEPIVIANEGSRRGVPLDVIREFREVSE